MAAEIPRYFNTQLRFGLKTVSRFNRVAVQDQTAFSDTHVSQQAAALITRLNNMGEEINPYYPFEQYGGCTTGQIPGCKITFLSPLFLSFLECMP
jgi:hypothetical protein